MCPRRSLRAAWWDYSCTAIYFVTTCTKNREYYFGNIQNGKMILCPIGIIADFLWKEIVNHASNIELLEYVVMPNHVHGIVSINDSGNQNSFSLGGTMHALSLQEKLNFSSSRFQNMGQNSLSSIIGSYKSAVSKHAHRLGFDFAWQPRFH